MPVDVSKHSYSLLLEKNSLLIFNDSLYSEHLHGIDALEEDSIDQTVVNAGRIDGRVGLYLCVRSLGSLILSVSVCGVSSVCMCFVVLVSNGDL